MTRRVQVLVDSREQEAFRRQAEHEGVSLSAWIREAAVRRLADARSKRPLGTTKELRAFFRECDAREAGHGPEPSWEEHVKVIDRSRAGGQSDT